MAEPAPLQPKLETKPIPPERRLLLTSQCAAEMLSVSVDTLAKLPILRVQIPNVRSVRYRLIDLEEYVRSLTSPKG